MNYKNKYIKYKNKYLSMKFSATNEFTKPAELNNSDKTNKTNLVQKKDDLLFIKEDFYFPMLLNIKTQQKLLRFAEKNGHVDLLDNITKILYYTDSIGEGWLYNKPNNLSNLCDLKILYMDKKDKEYSKRYDEMINEVHNGIINSSSPSDTGGSYLSYVTLAIYRQLLLQFNNFKTKKVDKHDVKFDTGKLKNDLSHAENSKNMNILYKITKIVAENDSIAEGWRYKKIYNRDDFKKDINLLIGNIKNYGSYLAYGGLPIYKLFLDLLDKQHKIETI
jgi:hypothetical protein